MPMAQTKYIKLYDYNLRIFEKVITYDHISIQLS